MYRLIWHWPIWILFTLFIYTPLIIIGWIVVPIATLCKAYYIEIKSLDKKSSAQMKRTYHFKWPWMWLWDNFEDGICAGLQYKDMGSNFKQIIYWSCFRNPVNNLRIMPVVSCKLEPLKIGFRGSFISSDFDAFNEVRYAYKLAQVEKYDTTIPQWFFAWQGLHGNWYWQFMFRGKLKRFWIGWKIYPTTIYKIPEYQKRGAGFGLQFKTVEIKK